METRDLIIVGAIVVVLAALGIAYKKGLLSSCCSVCKKVERRV